jgi:hypothetical protein
MGWEDLLSLADIFYVPAISGDSTSTGDSKGEYVVDTLRVTAVLSEQNKALRGCLNTVAEALSAAGKSTDSVRQVSDVLGSEPSGGVDLAIENDQLVECMQHLCVLIGGEAAVQEIQGLTTYDMQRVCPHGHEVPDDKKWCPQCGLIIDDDIYNECSAEVRKVIAAAAKMIAGFKALAATENENKTLPAEANVTTSQNTTVQPSAEGEYMSDETADDQEDSEGSAEEYILQAQGLEGTLNLLKGKVQLVFASETVEIPIRRISSVLYSEATFTENGHVQFRRFLEEGTTSLFGRTESNTLMSFSLDEQGDFLAILDDVQAQIDTLDNADWLYDLGETEEAGEETSQETPMTSMAAEPQPAIQPTPPTAAIPAPAAVAPPIPMPPVSAAITVAEAAGTTGRLQLLPDRVRLISTAGESQELLLKHVTLVELQPASSGGLQEGFIHLHRLIDDKDLSRAVPSAFATLTTDWAKVEIFRVSFRSEQEPDFVRLKGEIEARMASLDTMATFLTLSDILRRLQELEAEVTRLKPS